VTGLQQKPWQKSVAKERREREHEVKNNTGFLSMRSQAVIQQKQVASKQRKVQDQVCHSKSLPPSHSDINITVFSWYQQLEEAANQVTKVSQFRVFSTQHGDRGLNGHHLATDYTDCHP